METLIRTPDPGKLEALKHEPNPLKRWKWVCLWMTITCPELGLEWVVCVCMWAGGERAHMHLLASAPVSSLPGLTAPCLPGQERGYCYVASQEPVLNTALLALWRSGYQFGPSNF